MARRTTEAAGEPAERPRRRRAALDRDGGAVPIYLRLANRLLDGIQDGTYGVGSLLPTEVELAQQYGVSRQSVRQAIAQLRQKGLVSARKGVGTRVESIRAARRFNYSVQSVSDLFDIAAETLMVVEKRASIVARGPLAARLGCRSGHRWLHLGCVRTIANEVRPICWTDIFIDGRLAHIVKGYDRFRSAIFGIIEREAGETVVDIQQEVRAVILEEEMAGRIAASPGSPALQITRRYFSTGRRLIQVSVNTLPADRFFYAVDISRQPHGAEPA